MASPPPEGIFMKMQMGKSQGMKLRPHRINRVRGIKGIWYIICKLINEHVVWNDIDVPG